MAFTSNGIEVQKTSFHIVSKNGFYWFKTPAYGLGNDLQLLSFELPEESQNSDNLDDGSTVSIEEGDDTNSASGGNEDNGWLAISVITDEHCLKCHQSVLADEQAYISKKDEVIRRISIDNKSQSFTMPPNGGQMTDEEREKITSWLQMQ